MADKRIDQLPAAEEVLGTHLLVIADPITGEMSKATVGDLPAPDVELPALQAVTEAGATTTEEVTVGGLSITTVDDLDTEDVNMLVVDVETGKVLKTTMPVATIPTLDQVTDEGASTTNAIETGTHTITGTLIASAIPQDSGSEFIEVSVRDATTGEFQTLATGSDGDILTAVGGVPAWATPVAADHGALTGLSDDDHTQYALSAGRSGGQTITGGTGTTDDLILKTTSGVGATGADMIFKGGNNGATEFVRILNNGNVGIGTTTPANKLSIIGNVPSFPLILQVQNPSTSTGQTAASLLLANSASSGELFKCGTNYTPYKNIGASDVALYNSGAGNFSILNDVSAGGLDIAVGASSTPQFTMLSTGLVGISTTAPNSSLNVGGSVAFGYRAITASRTLDVTDHLINCTANSFTVTLPTAVGITGRQYIIKNTGTATVITIATTGSQTIDGAAPTTITTLTPLRIVSDGANWITLNQQTAETLIESVAAPLTIDGDNELSLPQAGPGQDGYLAGDDWSAFNDKQDGLTPGNVSETGSSVLEINGGAGGANTVLGDVNIEVKAAGASQSGYLSSADWNAFNGKTLQDVTDEDNTTSNDMRIERSAGEVAMVVKNTHSTYYSIFYAQNDVGGETIGMFKNGSSSATEKTMGASDGGLYNGGAGNISILNDVADGNVNITAGGSSTPHLVINPNGTVNISKVIALTAIAFASLPASPTAGMIAHISDSNSNLWGLTIAGGGSNVVIGFYNGTVWTVMGK